MAQTDPKMNLVLWDQLSDNFDNEQLSDNFWKIGYHDHTPGRGVQIPTEGIFDEAVTSDKLADGAVEIAKLAANSVDGSKVVAGSLAVAKFATGSTGLAGGAFNAYRSGALTGVAASSTTLIFDAETFDVSNWYDTANGRYTPQIAGFYRISWSVGTSTALASTKQMKTWLNKNGTGVGAGNSVTGGTTGPAVNISTGSVLVQANGTTDYFNVNTQHTEASIDIQATNYITYFCGEFVGAS